MNLHVIPIPSAPSAGAHLLATDTPRSWWRIDCGASWSTFLATHQPAPPPVVCEGDAEHAFVGAEQAVFVLHLATGAVVASIEDLTDVQSFQRMNDDRILVIAGDQLAVFEPSGTLLWRQTLPDLIEDVDLHLECMQVTDQSGEIYTLSTRSGQPVSGEAGTR